MASLSFACAVLMSMPVAAAEEAAELSSSWGEAKAELSDEYRFGSSGSVKLEFPDKGGGVWFKPHQRDWSNYRELVFTLYNPLNDPKTRIFMLRDGQHGSRPVYLPADASISGGALNVPRETRVTFRLDLTSPSLREAIDLTNITGIHIGKGTPETTLYLEGFQLRTHEEVDKEVANAQQKQAQTILERLSQLSIPKSRKKTVEQLKEDLRKLPLTPPDPEKAGPLLEQAATLASVLEQWKPGESRSFAIHSAPSTAKIFREDPLPAFGSAALEGARNEKVSFQTIIVPFQPLRSVELTPLSLEKDDEPGVTISANAVRVETVAYIEVKHSFYYESSREGWWPDPLLPSRPLDIGSRMQPYWITVSIPAEQPPGLYHGRIRVSAEGEAEQFLSYQLRVWDFTLPVRGRLQTLISFTYKPADEAVRRACYSTLLDHRISPLNIYINASVQTGYQPERSDLQYCLERGLNTLVLWNPHNSAAEFPYDFDDAYIKRMIDFVADYKPELERLGAWEMSMLLGFDEITHKEKAFVDRASAGAEKVLSAIRSAFPDLMLANIGGPPVPSTLQGPGNIWIPQTSIVEPKWREQFNAMREQSGSRYFFYWVYGDPSFMLDLPAIAPRWLSWIAFKYGASGIGYYSSIRGASFHNAPTGVDWPQSQFNIETTKRRGRNGDGALVYPARDGTIMPSIRLANTRDGIEDYEYLALLRALLITAPDAEAARLLELPDEFLTNTYYSVEAEPLLNHRRKVAEAIERLSRKTQR